MKRKLKMKDVYPHLNIEEQAATLALRLIEKGEDPIKAFEKALRQLGHPAITDRH